MYKGLACGVGFGDGLLPMFQHASSIGGYEGCCAWLVGQRNFTATGTQHGS